MAGFDLKDLKEYFSIDELRTGGFKLADLLNAGYAPSELKIGGHFTALDFCQNGTPLERVTFSVALSHRLALSLTSPLLLPGTPVADVKDCYTTAELRAGGYTAGALINVGMTAHDCRTGGYTAGQLRAASVSASALKSGGYNAGEMASGGYSTSELKE